MHRNVSTKAPGTNDDATPSSQATCPHPTRPNLRPQRLVLTQWTKNKNKVKRRVQPLTQLTEARASTMLPMKNKKHTKHKNKNMRDVVTSRLSRTSPGLPSLPPAAQPRDFGRCCWSSASVAASLPFGSPAIKQKTKAAWKRIIWTKNESPARKM